MNLRTAYDLITAVKNARTMSLREFHGWWYSSWNLKNVSESRRDVAYTAWPELRRFSYPSGDTLSRLQKKLAAYPLTED